MTAIQRVLISVSDKSAIVEFARGLAQWGPEILSTGGTAKTLATAGVAAREVSDYTGFPEMLDGRVKTLVPKIHGGILGRRGLESHVAQMKQNGIEPIDMVVVNLYPFEATIEKPDVTLEEAIENIDIGGPAMLRSAAKNHADVAVVVDPADYPTIIEEMKANGGALTAETRAKLATKAFAHTAWYDGRIHDYLEKFTGRADPFPERVTIQLEKKQSLRYGENPHQSAAFYRTVGVDSADMADAEQLHGKEMSYNNIVDMAAAYELACEFAEPCVAIIKHTNPCGVAVGGESLERIYLKARQTDPDSAFGGVIAINREVDEPTAREIAKVFVEVVIAPGYAQGALEILTAKKNIRLMSAPLVKPGNGVTGKFTPSGILLQQGDAVTLDEPTLKVVSKRQPTDEQFKALKFAWTVAKHVKSNAIVYADADSTIGIGAGQMSRVDSARIAGIKAHRPVEGAVMASDAFFPFRDGIDAAGKAGITAVIQPGGSIRDKEVIEAANENNMAMVFTGIRHFRH